MLLTSARTTYSQCCGSTKLITYGLTPLEVAEVTP